MEDDEKDYDADYSEPNEPFGMAEAEEEDNMGDDEVEDILKQLDDEEDAKHTAPNIGALREAKTKWENTSGKAMYDQFKEIDNLNGQEVLIGIDYEMQKNHELTKKDAAKIVIKNLKKQPFYYTNYKLSGVEGYEPGVLGNIDPKVRQMKAVAKDNLVDKGMGMKPVKNIAKVKASANKAKKETNKAKDIDVLSLVAQTLRGVPKMQSQGEKSKTIKLRETIQKLVKEVLEEDKTLNEDFKYFKDFAEFKKDLFDKWPEAEKHKKEYEDGRIVYSDGHVNWGIWDPNRPNTPSKLPPGAVNQNVGMTARDLKYPQGSKKD
jgi:flavodoxin